MDVPVLETLTKWAISPHGPHFSVLYGGRGSGKTVTVQKVTHDLRVMNGPKTTRTPHYFSLEYCTFSGSSVPTIEELLTESIRRHWSSEGNLPTGKLVLAQAKRQPTVFIIDGFDWLAMQLTKRQQQALMHELLKLAPRLNSSAKWRGPWAGDDAKVLLTMGPEHKRLVQAQHTGSPLLELLLGPL
ncbi:MAG TPA: NACHT domain-containing protein [Candidatus Saccharimonadales bacterium]